MRGFDVASASVRPELIERIESGSGADRELDLAICLAVGRLQQDHDGSIFYIDEDGARVFGGHGWEIITPELTGSLDRTVFLIEKKLPEITDNSAVDFLAAAIEEMMMRGWRPGEPNIPQICRAVLASYLRALEDSKATLADAHSKSPSRPAMPKEEDTHG